MATEFFFSQTAASWLGEKQQQQRQQKQLPTHGGHKHKVKLNCSSGERRVERMESKAAGSTKQKPPSETTTT